MKTKNILITGAVAIVLIAILIIGFTTGTANNNNTTNDTNVTITLNDTNNTANNTTETTQKTQTKSSTQKEKTDERKIVSESIEYNYQVDDGSYYRQIEYSDGSFDQVDMNGKSIIKEWPE